MLSWLKRGLSGLLILILILTAGLYGLLSLSLPALDGKGTSDVISKPVILARDSLGQAVITANTRQDAAYALGFAHGQDRFFQMDLLRRNAAGELSELFGKGALELDKKMRFHQLRARSQEILKLLPEADQQLLATYTQGVNEGRNQAGIASFEYLLSGAQAKPWLSEDSLLVIFSMYLDLQAGTYFRDEALIHLDKLYGEQLREFILQPSQYQAALDGSKLPQARVAIPELISRDAISQVTHIKEQDHYGSNNWAVTGALTKTGKAMLSDDMHLGLNVPSIWYRAQLNYRHQGEKYQVTGVTLPGTPAVVVGSNDHIAWGFTNGYLDTADWIALTAKDKTWQVNERIALPNGEHAVYELTMSDYGPVKEIQGQQYALSWVAHQSYAVNLELLRFERTKSVEEAVGLAPHVGIPVQNLMVVDDQGNAAWKPMGAVPARTNPADIAQSSEHYAKLWQFNEVQRPQVVNPQSGKLWTGNSRVVSAVAHQRFGDGGYALGARSAQIRDRLLEKSQFSEKDFYAIQLDNEARFLMPWHKQLSSLLRQDTETQFKYQIDLSWLDDWQQCACAESVGYTLVRYYRDSLIDTVFVSVERNMKKSGSSLSALKNYLEPALWQLLNTQPESWLHGHDNWQALQIAAYEQAKQKLAAEFGPNMAAWTWGEVNALQIQHPFSKQLPILSHFLNMPKYDGFGDSYMPAVQRPEFGASQRFIVQPGELEKAIMTVAGGQSGHPLSPFYRSGFEEYAQGENTPLLPQVLTHEITFTPQP
ncbi:penicillin acylase family protein [Pseudoalteromonas phenolica]|uniref:penicillin acylase family protein n=1 Tax=Pseudoalteromonas phenolica TaxID=161398 RepID=UPI00110B4AED|nr:penicillin acylase family protein [Pseudoalteromonas phenolica]TMN87192.1 penicillin acylase family protein [Pseudoalteromonas phenolica]